MARIDGGIADADITGKIECAEYEESEPTDKAGWIVRKISELGVYENVSDSVPLY